MKVSQGLRSSSRIIPSLGIEHVAVRRLAANRADLTEDTAGGELGKELLAAAHAHGHVNAAADDDEAAAAGPTFAHHHSSLRQVLAAHEPQQLSKLAIAEINKEGKVAQRIRLDRRPRLRGHPLQRHGRNLGVSPGTLIAP